MRARRDYKLKGNTKLYVFEADTKSCIAAGRVSVDFTSDGHAERFAKRFLGECLKFPDLVKVRWKLSDGEEWREVLPPEGYRPELWAKPSGEELRFDDLTKYHATSGERRLKCRL